MGASEVIAQVNDDELKVDARGPNAVKDFSITWDKDTDAERNKEMSRWLAESQLAFRLSIERNDRPYTRLL